MKATIAPALLALALLGAGHAGAAPQDIRLPAENVKLKPAKLPGYGIAMQKCAICHSADYVSYQPPGLTLAQWTAEMKKMQQAYGAPIDDGEVEQLGAYLAVAYGSAKIKDPEIVAIAQKAGKPAASHAAATTVDVQGLLAKNACLSCHGVTQKLVGPAYHEVATRYKGDAQAQARLEASIRGGSSGKWGAVPMPPFAGLKPEEVKALATYVRQQ
ncbi:SULFITE:CYTOCHROME C OXIDOREDUCTASE (SUBUNIT B) OXIDOREDUCTASE PROTEIN [Cupriavidus taiwanensis]|uniref:SULFITE:CYTOCHROME C OXIDOREDUCTASE (SUBUNIT B) OXIDOREDUCTASE PROTEIN n=1 Tax=Cupriavidus taiwanensis TaxID=164546 RepID=A0A375EFT2_9BURK|nr:c-type cytochrome [Cupriavidus taiwanensis]SOZ62799.1 SULFITE:CYTOCHROME C OXIDOREDUCTASE (SUBUNIT B) OXIDOREDUCTASE PROTEIN [Cupriavidus taiwanensis]SOZ63164.1 SULFITE:CYTOCHROME C OXIDOREDUCTASE (SUBUNIT B) OXIDOREDUCTASE PROTEIN [Cupriavidus taiwanensis]SOZ74157.1 SULFITE:CYTOCHROME C OXIDOREDUCTASE (SUBUNIT B) OXIDOREDUCTASE PROTEIN [Cupriavidus taiwanensis]SPA11058.1 SULFITE:CYTOCHROME C OXIDOREDUCTASE (SUBUNIT B) OXIDOREDUCTASE PROTEIN [Cupriavidus taiwanensis]